MKNCLFLIRVSFVIALLMFPFIGNAETQAEPFVELTPTIGLGKNSQANLQLLGGSTWKVADGVSLGFGAGVNSSFKFNVAPSIPVFFRSKFDFGKGNIVPFLLFDLGYNFNLDDFDYSSVLISPTVGFRTHGFYLGVGYIASIATQSNSSVGHNLAFRLGYQFGGGNHSRKMKTPDFIKKSDFIVEAGYAYGLTKKKYLKHNDDLKTSVGSEFFARATWMFHPGNHFGIGLGSGVNVSFLNFDLGQEQIKRHPVDIPVYLRPQIDLASEGSSIKPYVACDLGYRIPVSPKEYKYYGLMVEPQVGVSFNDKLSVALGYNLSKYKDVAVMSFWDEPEDPSCIVSAVSMRLGFTF